MSFYICAILSVSDSQESRITRRVWTKNCISEGELPLIQDPNMEMPYLLEEMMQSFQDDVKPNTSVQGMELVGYFNWAKLNDIPVLHVFFRGDRAFVVNVNENKTSQGCHRYGAWNSPMKAILTVEGSLEGILCMGLTLSFFHDSNKFCSSCGDKITMCHLRREVPYLDDKAHHDVEVKGECTKGHDVWPRTNPCVIIGIHDGERIILITKNHSNLGRWSNVAGFVESGESVEACIIREIMEETGIGKEFVESISYYSSQSWPFPNNMMLGFIVKLSAIPGVLAAQDTNEILQAKAYNVDELPAHSNKGSIGYNIIHEIVRIVNERQKTR